MTTKTTTYLGKLGFLVLFFISCALNGNLFAQQDTEFWFAAPEVAASEGDSPIYLRFMTYDDPAQVTVSLPANGAFTPIVLNIPANNIDSINLSPFLADIESPSANAVNDNGIHIVTTNPVSAYYELKANGNRELFSLKGTKAIGTDFYTPFQKFWNNGSTTPASFSSFEIVATENNTTVLITPRTAITGHAANATFSVILQQGETYSARDMNSTATSSLAGSIISANKDICVTTYSGALSNSGCLSTMGDQITSSEFIGNDYIIHRSTMNDEKVYILATENSTSIQINDGTGPVSTLINWGETYEFDLSQDISFIHTSKPVYVWHASGYGCSMSGTQVPNLFCAGKYNQAFSRSSSDSLGLLLTVRSGFEGDFTLNGSTGIINAGDFAPVPGTSGNFMAGIIYLNTTDVPVNSYNNVNNTGDVFGLAVIAGDNANGSGYTYHSEFISYPFVDAGPDATICANVPFSINGLVGGGTVTGTWGTNGFGSFDQALTVLNNTYEPSPLDSIISPINLILSSTGPCPVQRDTLVLTVTPGPIVNAGANVTVCSNNANVSLSGSIAGGATGGVWSSLGTGTFSPNNTALNATYVPSSADTTAGSVQLVLESTGNGVCVAETDTMLITFTPAPIVDAGNDTITVCANNATVSLNGSAGGATTTAKWSTSGSGIFSPNSSTLNATYTPTPSDISAGYITLYLESTNNGNCISARDSLVVEITASPVVNAGTDIIACTNESSIDLSGIVSGPTTTGTWSGGAGSYSPSSNDLNASYTPTAGEVSAGFVILDLSSTNNGNCNAEQDQVQINFVAPPFANFNFTTVCQGAQTDFTDFSLNGFGSITSWTWDFGDSNGSSNQNPNHTYASSGLYSAELIVESSVGCTDTVVKQVEVFELPIADFSWTTTCNGTQITADFTDLSTTQNDNIVSWMWDFGGQGSQSTQNPTQLFNGDGNFTITQIVETDNGCRDTSVQVLTIQPLPEAGFFYNTSNGLNIGADFTFIDTSNNSVAWDWVFDNGDFSSMQNPSTTYFSNGQYIVTQYAYNNAGCVDSTSTIIVINTVTTEVNTLIPNAISPNGDGKNDVWKLEFINFLNPNAEISIFNRWGQTVFESIGYAQPWDGTFLGSGDRVPEGTYYYVIKISDDEVYKGSILVYTARK